MRIEFHMVSLAHRIDETINIIITDNISVIHSSVRDAVVGADIESSLNQFVKNWLNSSERTFVRNTIANHIAMAMMGVL